MDFIPRMVVLLIAAEHLYILWMEMFAWKTAGKKCYLVLNRRFLRKRE